MKTSCLIFCLLIIVSVTAQTEVYISGGINNTTVRINKTRDQQDKYFSRYGWDAGFLAEHLSKDHFIVSGGLSISSNRFIHEFLSGADAIITYNYQPVYLLVPFNIGYSLPVSKNISTRFYGGFSYSMGIGGDVNILTQSFYPGYSTSSLKRKIQFGNEENVSNGSDLSKHYWEMQIGFSLALFKKIQLGFFYNLGLTNILPKYVSDYENQKLDVINATIKYNLLHW